MKNLLVIRHAKSSWEDFSLADHDRPLNNRGKRDAPLIGEYLAKRDKYIDLFYSSTAKRARTTARRIKKAMGSDAKLILEESFYTFSDNGDVFIEKARALQDIYKTVAVFGHNETLVNLAYRLSGGKIIEFPTCSCISVKFDVPSWRDINIENAQYEFFIKPKMLKP